MIAVLLALVTTVVVQFSKLSMPCGLKLVGLAV